MRDESGRFVIDECWIIAVVHPDGDEGLPAFAHYVDGQAVAMPMVACDRARRDDIVRIARALIARGDLPGRVVLKRLSTMTEEEVLQ